MRYKVPQDVQRADQIIWFLTLRQLIILLVGFGISYMIFNTLNQIYVLGTIEQILIWIPGMIAVAFAFVKIKGMDVTTFLLRLFEQTMFRAPRRRWMQNSGSPFVSMTTKFRMRTTNKKSAEKFRTKKVTPDKIKGIVSVLDEPAIEIK